MDGQSFSPRFVPLSYVHGPGVDEPLIWYEGNGTTAKSWLYADHLGSIVATANASGTSSNINTYGPFGESAQTTPDNNRFGYTGQQLKGLGLNYYKARVYSPALGRFLQADPIGYADDLNLYGYVGNGPVNATDPEGLAAAWLKDSQLIANDAPIFQIGNALGGVAAAGVGAATGNASLFNAAMEGLAETQQQNLELLPLLIPGSLKGIGNGSTSLYQKIGPSGEHLKFGIANNPSTRYTAEELGSGRLKILATGDRKDMLKLERGLHETLPIGPQEGQKFYIQKQLEKGLKPQPYNP